MQITSEAWGTFNDNLKDVERLLAIHKDITGSGPGRKYGVEVLNKACIVLLTAAWEAFIEDLCRYAIEFILQSIDSPDRLPKGLKKSVAQALQGDKDSRCIWTLAGDGWKSRIRAHSGGIIQRFNTPKPERVEELLGSLFDMVAISKHWRWQGTSIASSKKKLAELIELRGALAHGDKLMAPVQRKTVEAHKLHVAKLVERTTIAVADHLRDVLGPDATRTVRL